MSSTEELLDRHLDCFGGGTWTASSPTTRRRQGQRRLYPVRVKANGPMLSRRPVVPYSLFVFRFSLSLSASVPAYAHPLVDPQFAHL